MTEERVRVINIIALVLMVIGALNWGLVGLFEFDLVAALFGMVFGETNAATRIIYILVGLAGLWGLYVLAEQLSGAPAGAGWRQRPRMR